MWLSCYVMIYVPSWMKGASWCELEFVCVYRVFLVCTYKAEAKKGRESVHAGRQ